MAVLIAILLIIVLVFGIASGMQSYASAKQAQATIEVAQAAQVNAWGNLVVIVMTALVILCVMAVIIWLMWRLTANGHQQKQQRTFQPREETTILRPASVELLIQLKMLEMLERMGNPSTPSRPELEADATELEWLRQR